MRYQSIVEGATLVHQADRAARVALEKVLDEYMETLWRPFNPKGYDEENPDQHHDDYDRFYKYYLDKSNELKLIAGVCNNASKALTDVVRDDLERRYGAIVMFDQQKISTNTMVVEVLPQPTEGEDAHKGGFFSPGGSWSWIRVHITPADITAAAMAAVQTIAFGEGEDRDALVDAIAPTFAHEYSHLLQYLGAQDYRTFKSGITTLGGKNAPRQGDRSATGWWRYIGSTAEIDSFASGCASEIINNLSSRRWHSSDIDNSDIDRSLESIALGYGGSRWYDMYLSHYYDALAGHYQEIGLSLDEAKEVWRRFLKTVYAKLVAYKKTTLGRDASGWKTRNSKPEWQAWARRGLPFCVSRMADEIAREAASSSYKAYDGEWRIEPYSLYDNACDFIEGYFFKDDYDFGKSQKIIKAFKSLIVQRLPRYQHQDAA